MRTLLVGAAACVAAAGLVTGSAPAAPRPVAQNLTRAQIRSMPILERPDRPIHVYGNAVRRRAQRSAVASPAPAPVRPAPAR